MIVSGHLPGWLAAALVVAVSTCLLVSGAAVGASLSRSAVWQRAFWRVAILSILVLLAADATGVSQGIGQWWYLTGAAARTMRLEAAAGAELPTVPLVLPEPRNGATAGSPPRPAPAPDPDEFDEAPLSSVVSVADAAEPFGLAAARQRQRQTNSEAPDSGQDSGGASIRSTTVSGASEFGGDRGAVWLAVVWGLGTGLLWAHLGVTHWRWLLFRRQQPRLHDLGLQHQVARLAAGLGWKRRIDLLVSPDLETPIALGMLRPVIVFPTGFCTQFDRSQQSAVLAHEVAHLAAGDPVWQLLADLAVALLWWHPAVWWARRRCREAGELAADEASLLVPQGADALAACLVVLARQMEPGARWASLGMAGAGWRSGLGRRVERLLDLSARGERPVKRRRIRVATVTIAMIFVLVAISCTARARTRAPVAEGVTTMKVFVNCWRQSLAAVTLAAVLGPASPDISRTLAAEAERDVPRISAEEAHEREPEGERDREHEPTDAPREHAERKPEASPEREHGAEGAEAREAQMREWAKRRAPLQERANSIRHKLRALEPHQDAERRELTHALEGIEVQLHQLEAQAPGREHVREQPERDPPPVRREAEEVQRRLRHLRVAVDNLRAAGLHEQANALARDGERLVHGDRPAAPERERRPEAARDVPAPAPQLEQAVRELHGQVQELRRQMEEIRHHLRELAGSR